MNRLSLFFLRFGLWGLLLLTAACNQKTAIPAPAFDTPAFVGPQWTMAAFYLNPSIDFDGVLDTDLLPFMDACNRDNEMLFGADGTLSLLEGPTSCGGSPDANRQLRRWAYNASQQTLTLTKSDLTSEPTSWTITAMTPRTMTVETTITENSKPYRSLITWKANLPHQPP